MTRSLVIFLHGVHASGDDLAPLARIFGQFLPNADFVSPDAPERTPVGYQWFDLDGVTPQNRAQRVIDARAKFDALLTKICEAHGAKGAYERIALVGFSQGSIMTYDALASGRWPVAAAVAFSGRYAPIPDEKPVKTPLLIIHGRNDATVPVEHARRLYGAAGEPRRLIELPDQDHSFTGCAGRFVPAVAEWLAGTVFASRL